MTHDHDIHPRDAARRLAASAVLVALVLMAGTLGRPAQARAVSAGFSVEPLRQNITGDPGTTVTKPITITNTMGRTMTFTVDKQDFAGSRTDPYAAPVLLGGQVDSPISAAQWLQPDDGTFTLDANQVRTIDVAVTIPKGSSGGHYAAVTIATAPQAITPAITAESRVAVLFFINAGSVPPPELVITDVYVNGKGKVVINYRNRGNSAASPTATIVYRDPITGKTTTVSNRSCHEIVLPDAAGRCIVEQPKHPGGPLQVGTAELTFDGLHTKAALPQHWNTSWKSLLLPITGLAMLVLWFVGVRRWRRAAGDDLVGLDY